jgi:hypothetical protein
MVVEAEQQKADLKRHNEGAGVLFKIRDDPGSPRSGPGCAAGPWMSFRS